MNSPAEAADLYERVRRREQRWLEDSVVSGLPESGPLTRHADEWKIRKRTMRRLLRTIGTEPRTLLEIGCGNGWLSAHLARHGHVVTGLDTGAVELAQAARVFGDLGITWTHGDPGAQALTGQRFDRIVLAASIQYFQDLLGLMTRCRELLAPRGEVIVVDSPFYEDEADASAARMRSENYYGSIGIPEMSPHYHHHTWRSMVEAAGTGRLSHIKPRGRLASVIAGRYPFPIVHIRY